MTANVSNEKLVLLPGDFAQRSIPAAQVVCYQSDGEALVSMDNRGWLPFSRGIELNAPDGEFQRLYFKNETASTITLEIAVISKPRVFVDRRELAASIAVDGGIVTNTAPLTDQGGSIRQYSASVFNSVIDATGGAPLTGDIITAAENVNGARIRHASLTVLVASGSKFSRLSVKVPQHIYIGLKDGADIYPDEFEIGPGVAFEYKVDAFMSALISVHYDLL